MRIVVTSSEAVPFAKTGGLADVATGLSRALAATDHEVTLVVPYYPRHVPVDLPCPEIGTTVTVRVGQKVVEAGLRRAELPDSRLRVILVDQPMYFDRPGLYTDQGHDYQDNCERFVFFSRAVLEAVARLDLRPDVIHVNDWQTSLLPLLLEVDYRHQPGLQSTGTVLTIHNLAFQGRFWKWDMLLTGLDWKYFNWRQLEFWGDINLLKSGIVTADLVTTVSPTYAREICTTEFGCGLETALGHRGDDLVGILNGVDTEVWNPARDSRLARQYDISNFADGKAVCKTDLQRELGLPARHDAPLFGMISRMTEQKGFDLIAATAERHLQHDLQMVFLGTGQPHYENLVRDLANRYPDKVAAFVGFDEGLAHRIEAGADCYFMPSRFEPCGLNQMYSLIYGTVPVVNAVGGLADSVVDATPAAIADGSGNGFVLAEYSPEALITQVDRAVDLYRDSNTWQQIVRNGMGRDWSWNRSAARYVDVYCRAHGRHAVPHQDG